MDGGTPSVRGARDHVQTIATSQGAPNSSESQRPFICPVCQSQGELPRENRPEGCVPAHGALIFFVKTI